MTRNSLAASISFTLALDASIEDVAEVINAINHQFGINSNAGTVSPSELVAVENTPPTNALPSPPPAAATGAALDKTGLPWDERIHASTKAKNADGTWRGKRGVDEITKNKIEASLRATSAAPAPAVVAAPVVEAPPVATIPAPPPAPTLPGLPPLPGANIINTVYAELVKLVAENTRTDQNPAGRITDDWLVQTAIPHFTQLPPGTKLQDVAHRPDLVEALLAGLRASLGA